MELNASQCENRARGAVSPSELFLLGLCLSLTLMSQCPSYQGSLPFLYFSAWKPPAAQPPASDRVNQHAPPTPDGSLPMPLLVKNL